MANAVALAWTIKILELLNWLRGNYRTLGQSLASPSKVIPLANWNYVDEDLERYSVFTLSKSLLRD